MYFIDNAVLISAVPHSDFSYTYVYVCIYIYAFFFIMVYQKILNIVTCANQ